MKKLDKKLRMSIIMLIVGIVQAFEMGGLGGTNWCAKSCLIGV